MEFVYTSFVTDELELDPTITHFDKIKSACKEVFEE
jgi:hypothetical protein